MSLSNIKYTSAPIIQINDLAEEKSASRGSRKTRADEV